MKEQLLKIEEYYKIEIGDRRSKDTVRDILRQTCLKERVLFVKHPSVMSGVLPSSVTSLSFDQQKELL